MVSHTRQTAPKTQQNNILLPMRSLIYVWPFSSANIHPHTRHVTGQNNLCPYAYHPLLTHMVRLFPPLARTTSMFSTWEKISYLHTCIATHTRNSPTPHMRIGRMHVTTTGRGRIVRVTSRDAPPYAYGLSTTPEPVFGTNCRNS